MNYNRAASVVAVLATIFTLSSSSHDHDHNAIEMRAKRQMEKHHYEGIVLSWLEKLSRRHKSNLKSSREVAHRIINSGGLTCWLSLIALTSEIDDSTNFRLRSTQHEEIIHICGGLHAVMQLPPPSIPAHTERWHFPEFVILNVQHNGLGNQLFQYVFSRLLAEGLGVDWKTSLIRPDLGESPRNEKKHPPNSHEGWRAFAALFGDKTHLNVSGVNRSYTGMNTTFADRGESVTNRVDRICASQENVIKLADRPVELRMESFSSQMFRALTGKQDACLKTIGYFQDALYFMPHRDRVRDWFDLTQAGPPSGYPPLGNDSIVVHVRSCYDAGMTAWHFLPMEYYDTILSHLKTDEENLKVYIVTTMNCLKSPLVADLMNKFDAKAALGQDQNPSTIDDFRFMLNSPRLLLGKSTFGFWAGFLSRKASAIHMPVEMKQAGHQKIPLAYFDDRFIFHHLPDHSYFGTAQSNTIRFTIHGGVKTRRWRTV